MLSLSTAIVLSLAGCSGSGGSDGGTTTATTSSGGASKGPFKQGSLVIAYKLDANGSRSTTDVNTTTNDNAGHFDFGSAITWTGPTEYVISGEYFNENTGQYMVLPTDKGLSAISNKVAGVSENININIFTNIEAKNIKAQMAAGASVTDAKAQAQQDVAELFNIQLDAGVELTDLDLTDSTSNTEANTQLLVLSSALLNTTDPEKVMEDLADDMADGEVDGDALGALDELKAEIANVDLEQVATTMEEADIGVTDAPSATSALDGTLSFDHTMSFTTQADAETDAPYTSNEVTVNGIIGDSGAISVTNGTYSIDGGAFTATAGTVTNGQTVRVKTTSSANYSTAVEAKLTIGGGVIPYSVTTKSDPFVPDTTPDAFSFGYKNNIVPSTNGVVSNGIVISGINTATPISVTGGTFTVDGGAAVNVNNGQTVVVTMDASANYGDVSTATVTIGDVNGTFKVFTQAEDKIPDSFSFNSVADVNATATPTVDSNQITISGINTTLPISIVDGNYSKNSGGFTDVDGTVGNGDTITVQVAASSEYETTTTATLRVGNTLYPFSVTTMSNPVVPDSTPNDFSFATKLNQAVDTDVESNVTVSGINQDVAISVTNGTYGIGGAGVLTDGNVSNGDLIVITQRTSASFETEKTTTVTIGGIVKTFKTKTIAEDTTPDDVSFDANLSVPVPTADVISNTVTIAGLTTGTTLPISIVDGEYSLDGGSTWATAAGTVANGTTVTLKQVPAQTQGTTKTTVVTVGSFQRSFTTKTVVNAPAISGTTPQTTAEDAPYSFTPTIDTNSGEITAWSIANKPVWADFNTVTGKVSGTPTNTNVGNYADINITATNGEGSSSFVYDLNVTNTNDAPIAGDTSVTTPEDTPIDVNASALVDDVDAGDQLTITIDTQAAHGNVVNNNGLLTYSPSENFFGTDSFTFMVTDTAGANATATVELNVTSVNDIAVISNTTGVIYENNASVSGVITVVDPDVGEAGLIEQNATGTYGSFNILSDASWTYTLTSDQNALEEGETLLDSRLVTSIDGMTTAELNISVVGVNDAPTLDGANTTAESIKKTSDLNLTVSANDVDNNAVVSLTAASATGATVNFDANGSITFNAPTAGAYTLNYTFSDEYNATVDGSIAVTVTNSDAPVAGNDTATIDEDNNASIAILENDSDDFTADENLTVTLETAPANGSAIIETDNTITYVPDANYNGTDGFVYKITDVDGGFATADVNITINAVNDAPVAVADANTTAEDTNVTINVVANDSDVDGDDFNITAVTQGANGSVTFDAASGTVTYSPDADYFGGDSFTYTINDGNADTNATVSITVEAVNDAPVVSPISDIVINEDENTTIDVALVISDVDDTNWTVTADTNDSMLVALNVVNDTLTLSPEANASGIAAINVHVTDNNGTTTDASFTLTINPVNDAPVVVNDTFNALANTTNTVSWNILANDSDVDGDSLSVEACDATSALGATITLSGDTIISYAVGDVNGTDTFDCNITDGTVSVTETVSVNVSNNHAPEANNLSFTMVVGETITGAIDAYDPEDDNLTYTVSGMTGSVFGPGTNLNVDGTYSVEANATGIGTISVDINDSINITTVTYTFNVIEAQTNDSNNEFSLSEFSDITSAEFDALSPTTTPADTKMYSFWGIQTDELNNTTLEMDYIMFKTGGVFELEEGVLLTGTHNENYSGMISVSIDGMSVDFKMLDDNVSASELASNLPFVASMSMPANAVVYKTAVRMNQDGYDVWGPATDWSSGSPVEYTALADMIDNNATGVAAYNRYNSNRLIVFAPGDAYVNGSGTVIEVDMTDVYQNGGEPTVINANAGTWSTATQFVDDSDAANNMIMVTIDETLAASGAYDKYRIFVAPGADIDGQLTSSVSEGTFEPAGSSYIEYRFNDVAAAVIQNVYDGMSAQDWITNVQDGNITIDLNTTTFDAYGNGLIDPTGSTLYSFWIDQNYAGDALPVTYGFEESEIIFGTGGSLTVNNTYNGVPSDQENLTYTVDGSNVVTVSDTGVPVFQAKIVQQYNASQITQMLGLRMPADAMIYEMAGLELQDSLDYWTDTNGSYCCYAEVRDSNFNVVDGNFTTINDFIASAQLQYGQAFASRWDGVNSYALAFEDNATGTSGNLVELNMSTSASGTGGTWEITTVAGEEVLLIRPANEGYGDDEFMFGFDGGNSTYLTQGNVNWAGQGEIEFHANKSAADVINANFSNRYRLAFSYFEIAGQTYYGVADDGTHFVTEYSADGKSRRFELNTFTFTGAEDMQTLTIDGNVMTLTSSTTPPSGTTITRTANYGEWCEIDVSTGISFKTFKNLNDANNRLLFVAP